MSLKRKSIFLLPALITVMSISFVGKDGMQEIGVGLSKLADDGDPTYTPAEDFTDIDFNFDWKFQLGDSGTEDEARPAYDDASWREVSLPHDWSIEQDFDANIPPAMGMLPAGQAWYRKQFTLDENSRGKKVFINFDGVYMDSDVYVNGVHIGNYPYGYIPFSYDITPFLHYDEVNTIAVRVNSPLGNGHNSSRWYAGAGINRDVTLSFENPTHLERDGVYFTNELEGSIDGAGANSPIQKGENALAIATAAPKTENVETTAHIEARNTSSTPIRVKARVSVTDYRTGEPIEGATNFESDEVELAANDYKTITFTYMMPTIHLWDINDPYLYNIKTELINVETGEIIDSTVTRYGYKKSVFTLNDGYYLNGRYVKLYGACMHPDQGALGNVADYEAVNRQMRIMHEMGVNSIRTAHCPFSETFMRACDENGILVMEEWFDMWTGAKNADDYHNYFNLEVPTDENHPLVEEGDRWYEYDLRMTLRRDRNCPSVIMYSIGNEISGYDGNYEGYAKNMIAEIRKNDDNTPVTMGFPMWSWDGTATRNNTTEQWRVANQLDIVGFNYPSLGTEDYDTSHENFNWIVFNSEGSSAWKSRGYFRNDWGSIEGVKNQKSSLDYDNHFHTMRDEWVADRDRQHVLGEYIWTGFDYIGEPQPFDGGSDPSKSSYYGSVDTAGFEKAEFYMLKSQWVTMEQEPFVKVVNHVNLEDDNLRRQITTNKDGKTVELWVSSNASSVRLTYVDDEGVEQEIGFKDWNQDQSKNKMLRLQEPLGNPSQYSNKLYQIFQIDWSQLEGHDVHAYAYDVPSDEVVLEGEDATTPIATDVVYHSNGSEAIKLIPEKRSIRADGHDLSYIEVDVTDAEGHINPNAMDTMTFSIKGDGEIVGVDNGDAYGKERYKYFEGETWTRSAFNGKALVIVKSTQEEGSFTLTAQGTGLSPAETTVFTTTTGSQVVNYAAETLSLTIKSGSTVDMLRKMLPAKISVYASDGQSGLEGDVTWDTEAIRDMALVKNNTFFIFGTVTNEEYKNAQAKCMVTITDNVEYSAESINLVTTPGVVPDFPSEVTITTNDGRYLVEEVTWVGDYNMPGNYADPFTYRTVQGYAEVNGQRINVTATVNVVPEESVTQGKVHITGTDCSYQEGVHAVSQVADGFIGGTNGWGNWQDHNYVRTGDWVQVDFAATEVSSVNIYFLQQQDGQWAYVLPESVEISYLKAGQYVPVTNQKSPSEFVSNWEDNSGAATVEPKSNMISFDPVSTTSLRITFNVDQNVDHNAASKDHGEQSGTSYTMLKVSEIEVIGDVISNLSPEAMIGDVWLDGILFEDFDYNTFSYRIGVENMDTAPIIQANGIFGSSVKVEQVDSALGQARIIVTSADGTQSLVYTFSFYIID